MLFKAFTIPEKRCLPGSHRPDQPVISFVCPGILQGNDCPDCSRNPSDQSDLKNQADDAG